MQTKEGVINGIVMAFVADMPAHSPVLVTKGTNGYFGCVTCGKYTFCHHPMYVHTIYTLI